MESPFEEVEMPIPLLTRSETRSDHTDEHNWSQDVEGRLEAIQDNSAQQALISKQQYLDLLYLQKFFKIPVIVVSGINSVFAVGLSNYASQSAVSILNCLLAFFCATVGSIELYLNISKRIEISLNSFQSFYLLSVKIETMLKLDREHRSELDGRKFLADCLNEYETLFSQNNISPENINDKLVHIKSLDRV
jgi:hypothetical protein